MAPAFLRQSSKSYSTTAGDLGGARRGRSSGDSAWSNPLELFTRSNPANGYRQARAVEKAKKNLTNIDEEGLAEDDQRTQQQLDATMKADFKAALPQGGKFNIIASNIVIQEK